MSVWQNSSDGPDPAPSNWGHYAASKKKKYFGQSEYQSAWVHSNDFWNLYEDDIKLAASTLGTNSFRFSFEWARIEPKGPGIVDQAAVDRYSHCLYGSCCSHAAAMSLPCCCDVPAMQLMQRVLDSQIPSDH